MHLHSLSFALLASSNSQPVLFAFSLRVVSHSNIFIGGVACLLLAVVCLLLDLSTSKSVHPSTDFNKAQAQEALASCQLSKLFCVRCKCKLLLLVRRGHVRRRYSEKSCLSWIRPVPVCIWFIWQVVAGRAMRAMQSVTMDNAKELGSDCLLEPQ